MVGEFEYLREVILEYKLSNEFIYNGEGEIVVEIVVRIIGKLGENIKINKVVIMIIEVSNVIGSYVYGFFVILLCGCFLGRYGGMVVLKLK